jgi:ribosomal peptide maturation radical SAM protein 1
LTWKEEAVMDSCKVLLLSMPYGALERPSLGLSLLKPCLTRCNIECDLVYFTFTFAEYIGYEEYRWITSELPYTAFAGDWTFAPSLYGEMRAYDAAYIMNILKGIWNFDDNTVLRLQNIRDFVPHFMSHCIEAIDWGQYAMVGFTSTFEQNIASLALAQHIKHLYPDMYIVFGGANWEAEMGLELHRKFPFVDVSFSGQAEESFPKLIQQLFAANSPQKNLSEVRGIVYRENSESIFTGPADPVKSLDDLPIADFSDYFGKLLESSAASSVVPVLLLETSRGCWWGAKNQCTFCGLNGDKVTYQSKSAGRVIKELYHLVDTWGLDLVEVVDNMLDMAYFEDVFPELAKQQRSLSIFYEVKSNLTREQVRILSEAGVDRIQPGIESLSSHVLQLMRKGTTALINIQLLKWCREYGVGVDWNLLYGFPGETREDYEYILSLLPAIRFLGPLPTCGPVRMDRFSPYYKNPREYGLINMRPLEAYRYIYPFEDKSISEIASCFDFDYRADIDPRGHANEVINYIDYYRHDPERGSLIWIKVGDDDNLLLLDSRSEAVGYEFKLSGYKKDVYEFCDSCKSKIKILVFLKEKKPKVSVNKSDLNLFLEDMVQNRLMITDGGKYLSLALPSQQRGLS